MLDVLSGYLDEAATPELKQTLEQAHELFERIGLLDFETGFHELLATDDAVDQGGTLEAIVDLTKQLQRKILAEHGIVLTDQATVEMHNTVIEGVMDIGNYGDAEAIVRICAVEVSANETFAELLALVCPLAADEILIHIEEISNTLIATIQQHVATAATPTSDASAEHDEYVARLIRFCDYISSRELLIVEAVTMGMSLGLPFESYVEKFDRDLETMSVDAASRELVAAALISSDGHETPQAVINEHLEHLISNPDTVTKVAIKVSDLLLGLQK